MSYEDEVRPKMFEMLDQCGLQITLKTLIDSLEQLMELRGKSIEGLMVLEALRGLHAGYLRRYETVEQYSEDYE